MKDRYIVVNAMLLEDFQQEVTKRLQEGFEISGGLGMGPRGFYQPMIKRYVVGESDNRTRTTGSISDRTAKTA